MQSRYISQLADDEKKRYFSKLRKLDFTKEEDGPYLISESKKSHKWDKNFDALPKVEFGDIYSYSIDSPGHTGETLKAYKSLDAYNFFISGWVGELFIRSSGTGYCVIYGKVNRSQALTEKPHEAWVGCKTDGTVCCGHCTCMAGLGLVCSHVAAILFKMEYATRMGIYNVACTSQACKWNQQSVKKVEGIPVKDVFFLKPRKNRAPVGLPQSSPSPAPKSRKVELSDELLSDLKSTTPNAVFFSIINPVNYPIVDLKNVQNL